MGKNMSARIALTNPRRQEVAIEALVRRRGRETGRGVVLISILKR
jgi:hypothetical protein